MSIELDLPDPDYRARPGLSYSGTKDIMRSVALFEHRLTNPRPDSTDFDVGTATHEELLGAGRGVELVMTKDDDGNIVPAQNMNRKHAQQDAARIRAAGRTPVTVPQLEAVRAMTAAVRAHPEAGKLLEPGRFLPEVSLFWTDPETGTAQKGRLDALTVENDDGRPEVDDVKTCTDVRRIPLMRHIHEHSYHWQAPHYVDGGLAAHGVTDVLWQWVFVEKTPPHLVRVVEPDPEMWAAGSRFIAEARRRYARFLEHGAPVDYPTADLFGLPRYAATDPEEVLP